MERQGAIFRNQKNVNEWLQAMDVFAFPSFAEGLGIVLIEAQAAGLPCCCTDTIPGEAKCSGKYGVFIFE
ncbi:MAG: glycosyltransferase [Sellimonas intestinalis]